MKRKEEKRETKWSMAKGDDNRLGDKGGVNLIAYRHVPGSRKQRHRQARHYGGAQRPPAPSAV